MEGGVRDDEGKQLGRFLNELRQNEHNDTVWG